MTRVAAPITYEDVTRHGLERHIFNDLEGIRIPLVLHQDVMEPFNETVLLIITSCSG